MIDDINKKDDILFVIIGGDITDQGLLKEFEIFYNVMKNLNKPYLTVIGNHDYRSNGGVIYKNMFGEYNYSFEFNNWKFILFDDIVLESNKASDFDWLSMQLSGNDLFKQVFVISHIPPFGNEFNREMEQAYISLLQENNVTLSMHGHLHSFTYKEFYKDNVYYLIGPPLDSPEYCIIKVNDKFFDIQLVEL